MQKVTSSSPMTLTELKAMAARRYGNLVKAVVDVEREVMVVDGELYADEERELLEDDSQQSNVWGINLYPEFFGTEDWIEFDLMINLRPTQDNRTRSIENEAVRQKIVEIVQKLVVS